jgi:flagellar protein FlbD
MRGFADDPAEGSHNFMGSAWLTIAASSLPIGVQSNPIRTSAESRLKGILLHASQPNLQTHLFCVSADKRLRQEAGTMIEVTRLNGNSMILNSDLIKITESSPDTMLTLIHGEKLIVRESPSEISRKVLEYRSMLLAGVASRMNQPVELHRVVAITSIPVQEDKDCSLQGMNETSSSTSVSSFESYEK